MKKAGSTIGIANIVRGDLPPHVLEFYSHSKKWAFVGKIDSRLAHVMADGSPVTEDAAKKAREHGPRLAGVRTRTWDTEEEAIAAAKELGYEVSQILR